MPPLETGVDAHLLDVRDLTKHYFARRLLLQASDPLIAVDSVSFRIRRGDTYGLVGESGCGKTTVARLLLGLVKATGGEARFDGASVLDASPRQWKLLRRQMQIIFQDPYSSLNPSFRVRQILAEGYFRRANPNRARLDDELASLLVHVGLTADALNRYPSQLSGGQRQRVGIARALAVQPSLIIADEPTSALDVSIQAQILNLFVDLQQELGLTYLFISHNIHVIRYICNRIGVMYLGRIVEQGSAQKVLDRPAHPYTIGLMSSMPQPEDRGKRQRRLLPGELPNAAKIPPGCRFHPRCPIAQAICQTVDPPEVHLDDDHVVACHFPVTQASASEITPA